jgi:hypothetical protein
MTPLCISCGKTPAEIPEYIEAAAEEPEYFESADDYVRREEGTYNPHNGHFLCTSCYIEAEMPSSPQGWRAP